MKIKDVVKLTELTEKTIHLAEKLKEVSVKRPLPVADIELEFYKIDGLTKDELQMEVQEYQERIPLKFKNAINKKKRNIKILFGIFQLILTGSLAFTLYLMNFLGYIQSYRNNIGWVKMLIPISILLILFFTFIFVKVVKFILSLSDENKRDSALSIFRNLILVLILFVLIGTGIQSRNLKSMQALQEQAGRDVETQFYMIGNMTGYVEQYLNSQGYKDGTNYKTYFNLYVNQTCYYFWGGNDKLHSNLREILISGYDIAYKKLVESEDNPNRDKIAQKLKELNSDLKTICLEILDKSLEEKADLVRYDNHEANQIRARIDNIAKKYSIFPMKDVPWLK
jgi:hypothetical protein